VDEPLQGIIGAIRESLGEIPHPRGRRDEMYPAAFGRFLANEDAQKGGLAAAVGSDESHALAGGQSKGDLLEDGFEIIGFGNRIYT
jgi:hypothetical protein